MCDFLASINWHDAFSDCVTAEQYWEVFRRFVEEAVDKYVPSFKQSKHVSPVTLYPRHIRKLRDTKRARWKLNHKFRTTELKIKYKRAAKRCSKAIKDLAIQKENGLCDTANWGSFYKYVNKKLNGSNGIAPIKDQCGTLTSDEYDKAEMLNNYFSSVFMHNGIIEEKWQIPVKATTMNPVFITPAMVQTSITSLKKPGGAGPDGLPSEFYSNTAHLVAYPLSVIYNISLQTGSVPSIWKRAVITPVFKKGSPSDPANYRPISLPCIACKLLEINIKDALLSYFVSHKMITRHQHGFLNKKSTTSHLLECSVDWCIAFNSKSQWILFI